MPIHEAFAPNPWTAGLNANLSSGNHSKGIVLAWDTDYPPACQPTRLQLRYNKLVRSTATAPLAAFPSSGSFLAWLDTDDSEFGHIPLHATTSYAYTIHACTSQTGCSSICTGVGVSDEAMTEQERWVVSGVHDYDEDTGKRVLRRDDWTETYDPELYRYDDGTHDGKIGLYFGGFLDGPEGKRAGIYVSRSTGTSWLDDRNDPDLWSEEVALAHKAHNDGSYDSLKNVMVVPTEDEYHNLQLRMLWTTVDGNDPDTDDYTLHSLLSSAADIDDFGVCCSDTADCSSTPYCPYDGEELCCDFEDSAADLRTEYHGEDGNCLLADGWHGHDLWDDLGPHWDPAADELSLLFSGKPTDAAAGCENCDPIPGGDPSDIDMWRWDTGGGCDNADTADWPQFCLEEEEEGDTATSWCPDEKWVDAHDPFSVGYLGDEAKVYFKIGEERWLVGYTNDNGRSFEDTSAIEFYFEDEDSGDTGMDSEDQFDPACVDDPSTIIWKQGAFTREFMVFIPFAQDDPSDPFNRPRCFATQDTGISIEDSGYHRWTGFLSAVLRNG